VACGTGNLALPAARAGGVVTGIDIAPNLIAQAQACAAAEGLSVRFEVADAESLPYADASFDIAVSMLGGTFAARPELTAAEMLRVVRPGGRIAMANCTRSGFIGQMLLTIQEYAPSTLDAAPVLQWGDESVIRERLAGAARIDCVRRRIAFDYACSPAETVALFRDCYAPAVCAFAVLDRARGDQLERELIELWTDHNRASDGRTRVESECLEVIATR
jgi:SAM-dependent methyltransferase